MLQFSRSQPDILVLVLRVDATAAAEANPGPRYRPLVESLGN